MYLDESRLPVLGEVSVEVEYREVVTVNRPYSREVGMFIGMVAPYLELSTLLIDKNAMSWKKVRKDEVLTVVYWYRLKNLMVDMFSFHFLNLDSVLQDAKGVPTI